MDSIKRKIFYFFSTNKKKLVSFLSLKEKGNWQNQQADLDKKLVYSLSKSKIPSFRQKKHLGKFLSKKETRLIQFCLIIIVISAGFLGFNFYKNNLKVVPVTGGDYIEGLIGSPKYINPLYNDISDVDKDISYLIYSSLFKRGSQGELIEDLINEYSVSEDGKTYNIKIKDNVKWHDEKPLTADDVLFTFNKIKDKEYNSPLRNRFTGVSLEKKDNYELQFILEEPYAGFIEILTFGILPQNLWEQIPPQSAMLAELNIKPIGSGPYKFESLTKDKLGNIREYELTVNEDFYDKKPYIKNIYFQFFVSFEEAVSALNKNSIDGISYLPKNLKDSLAAQNSLNIYDLGLPQINAVFFNQENNKALKEKRVREALSLGLNKEYLISTVLNNEVKKIDGPILPNNFAYNNELGEHEYNFQKAQDILTELGWLKKEITKEDIEKIKKDNEDVEAVESDEEASEDKTDDDQEGNIIAEFGEGFWLKNNDDEYLKIILTTINTEQNIKTIENIKKDWEKLGVKTFLNVIEMEDVQNQIIENRKFEALFYGQLVGADPDSYVFWHSVEENKNSLNITGYSNEQVDKLLEEARKINEKEDRINKYKEFQKILREDIPAIFLYSPTYTYIQSKKIKGYDVENIINPCNRFSGLINWYTKTGKKLLGSL